MRDHAMHHHDAHWSRPARPHRHDRDEFHGDPSHGRGRGPHGHGERGGRGRHDRMERGMLRFILLDALRDASGHGYEIIKVLDERTRGQYAPSPGALYPTLQLLEDLGHVRSRQEADRRVYEITDAGRAELEAQADRVAAFWARFASETPSEPSRHEIGFLQDELERLAGTVWGGLRYAIGRGDQETIRRVRQAIQRCHDEIRTLIADASSGGANDASA